MFGAGTRVLMLVLVQCAITEIPDIVDSVEVPADLPLGDYVISW